jgi:hypothetical protein
MMLSERFTQVYNEIRLLLQADMVEAANHALPELISAAVTRGQIAMAYAIEDWIIQKLDQEESES